MYIVRCFAIAHYLGQKKGPVLNNEKYKNAHMPSLAARPTVLLSILVLQFVK